MIVSATSVAVPVRYALVGGETAARTLQGWREWLAGNDAAVMAVLFVVIGAKLTGSGLDGLL